MKSLPVLLLVAATLCGATAMERAPRREIGNFAAFARVYGAVRYFYPSDSAASLDWDRFAVHGVRRVRAARDARALETTLEALFSPLGPGIVISAKLPTASSGKPDDSLIAWRYLGPGFAAFRPAGPYRMKRTNRPGIINRGRYPIPFSRQAWRCSSAGDQGILAPVSVPDVTPGPQ